MSDFLELARKVQARGMSVTEAVSKFKSALHRAGAPKKKAPKKPIRIVKDGIRIYPDGHERCITKAAWQKRRQEIYNRDDATCQGCNARTLMSQGDADHIVKRSVNRDDRPRNLRWMCNELVKNCHAQRHDEFRK